jgi:hypothetical protein
LDCFTPLLNSQPELSSRQQSGSHKKGGFCRIRLWLLLLFAL